MQDGKGACIAVLFICLAGTVCAQEDARIRCFLLGKVSQNACPFTGYFRDDPLFILNLEPIPADLPDSDKRKIDRQYFPRNLSLIHI